MNCPECGLPGSHITSADCIKAIKESQKEHKTWRYNGSKNAVRDSEWYCAVSGNRIEIKAGEPIPSGCECDGTVHPVSVWPPAQNGWWF